MTAAPFLDAMAAVGRCPSCRAPLRVAGSPPGAIARLACRPCGRMFLTIWDAEEKRLYRVEITTRTTAEA